MVDKVLLWVRRNTRKAVALALAPALLVLAADAQIGHFMGKESESPAQYVPVYYGLVGFLLLLAAALPATSRRLFRRAVRGVGAAGALVGLIGFALHLKALVGLLEGDYSWANLQGTFPNAPPLFAPLGFAGVGVLVFVLASERLLLRARVGRPPAQRRDVVPLEPEDRREQQAG